MTKTIKAPGKQAADILKANWDGNFPIDPFALAKAIGLKVQEDPDMEERCIIKSDDTAPVLYHCSKHKAESEKIRMSAAEAIGQYVMKECTDADIEDFAAVLLMPTEKLLELVMDKKYGIQKVAGIVQVTPKALSNRLKDLGVTVAN